MKAVEVLALIGGHVTQEVLLRNEYLAAENEILRSRIKGRLKLTDDEERIRLAKIGDLVGPGRELSRQTQRLLPSVQALGLKAG